MTTFDFSVFPRVNESAVLCSADIRSEITDFHVEEQLPFDPDGEGGHVWLNIQKQGINTDWLAGELAKFAGVKPVAVGYAGLKDRHAITTQWFSINLEGHDEPDWSQFENDEVKIISQTRHGKKLKRGVLSGNTFILRLRNIQGDERHWQHNLENIKQKGVPNYFGEQRFGHDLGNLYRAEHWFSTGKAPKKRNQKSLYLSAARSWLFNLIVAERIQQECWDCGLSGDMMLLSGTKQSGFSCNEIDETVQSRLSNMDIHPSAALWGRGELAVTDECLTLEQQVLNSWELWRQGLEKQGLNQERRATRLFSRDFNWQFIDDTQLELRFFLPAGCYATAVMRELAVITDVRHRNY